jgi:hypothetical protein
MASAPVVWHLGGSALASGFGASETGRPYGVRTEAVRFDRIGLR